MNAWLKCLRNKASLLILAAALFITGGLVVACGGGGGSSSGSTSSPARSMGEITALGSIFVNGVKYETEGGAIVGTDNLQPGMVVEVEGRINDDGLNGNAAEVKFDDNVTGPITSVTGDAAVTVGVIMGQTVIFEDNLTKFDANTGMPLGGDVNKVYMVSGFERDDGKIQATFASRVSDDVANFLSTGGQLEVTGTVSALNTVAQTFMINGLTIDYSNAVLRDLPTGLSEGLLVEVKGNELGIVPVPNTLIAVDIEGKAEGLGDDIAKVHVEGLIADLTGTTFTLNGQLVNYQNAAFRAGDATDLANGIKVEAEGPLSGGVLQAVRVTFKASVRIEAAVATKVGDTLTFLGLPGISVLVHPELTRDDAGAFAGLVAGNDVKVRARLGASDLVATRLEKVGDTADRTIIRGPVTNITGTDVTILETVVVNTATITEANFKDHDTVIGRAAFFANLKVGDIVKARFRDGNWDEIEFQD